MNFRIDDPDHCINGINRIGFQSKLKHRILGKIIEKLSTEVVKN